MFILNQLQMQNVLQR